MYLRRNGDVLYFLQFYKIFSHTAKRAPQIFFKQYVVAEILSSTNILGIFVSQALYCLMHSSCFLVNVSNI